MNNSDPYKVLGVSPSDSDEKIKSVYKELVKKYHPDQYQDNPLSDVAAEKMADINAAYDQIMSERRNGGGYSGGNSYSGGSASFDSNRVRTLIQTGNITAAEQILYAVPSSDRTAEWFFLKGSVCYKRGWLNEAYTNFQTAYTLQPDNAEYKAAFDRMNMSRGGAMNGSPYQSSSMNSAISTCNCCSYLCCADSCCECMGGDLIPCC